jgi:hypothetical protein
VPSTRSKRTTRATQIEQWPVLLSVTESGRLHVTLSADHRRALVDALKDRSSGHLGVAGLLTDRQCVLFLDCRSGIIELDAAAQPPAPTAETGGHV